MNKKRDRYFNNYKEIGRSSRVKLYKAGKKWVSTLLSLISLFHVNSNDAASEVSSDTGEIHNRLSKKSRELIKGITATGALLGGAHIMHQTAFADTTVTSVVTSTATGSTLATTNTVNLTSASTDSTLLNSTSEDSVNAASKSASESTSLSVSQSESLATSKAQTKSTNSSSINSDTDSTDYTSTDSEINPATSTTSNVNAADSVVNEATVVSSNSVLEMTTADLTTNVAAAITANTVATQATTTSSTLRRYALMLAAANDSSVANVSTATEFTAAMPNSSISTINVTADIDFGNTSASSKSVTTGRTITINGNDHTINFGGTYYNFTNSGTGSNIILNDATIYSSSSNGVFYFNNTATNNLTYNNVTATGGTLISSTLGTGQTTVTLSGDTTLTTVSSYIYRSNNYSTSQTNNAQISVSKAVIVSENANVTMTTSGYKNVYLNGSGHGYNFTVNDGATVNMTANSATGLGMLYSNRGGNVFIADDSTSGSQPSYVTIGNANVTMTMVGNGNTSYDNNNNILMITNNGQGDYVSFAAGSNVSLTVTTGSNIFLYPNGSSGTIGQVDFNGNATLNKTVYNSNGGSHGFGAISARIVDQAINVNFNQGSDVTINAADGNPAIFSQSGSNSGGTTNVNINDPYKVTMNVSPSTNYGVAYGT